jgi:hypothetical protein
VGQKRRFEGQKPNYERKWGKKRAFSVKKRGGFLAVGKQGRLSLLFVGIVERGWRGKSEKYAFLNVNNV